jgi:hypothetical protein
MANSVALGLFEKSTPDFIIKKTQKNPGSVY